MKNNTNHAQQRHRDTEKSEKLKLKFDGERTLVLTGSVWFSSVSLCLCGERFS